jgi:hypothetical protein
MTTDFEHNRLARAHWFAYGCVGIFVISLFVISSIAQRWEDGWEKHLATLIATDDSIAAFGDGAHAVSITPEAVLPIGSTATVEDLRVTVLEAGEVNDTTGLRKTAVGYLYWFFHFSIENASDETKYIHPIVDTQMQYNVHCHGVWEPNRAGVCIPSLKNGIPPLATAAKFNCRLIYEVPLDDQPLYWVYTGVGYESLAVFQVR